MTISVHSLRQNVRICQMLLTSSREASTPTELTASFVCIPCSSIPAIGWQHRAIIYFMKNVFNNGWTSKWNVPHVGAISRRRDAHSARNKRDRKK
mmetsp:Transcript_9104/g.23995  ORF Transcript_9104/g.23995 Transcript_9104/m.23995 type:complete len:95 (-) Transcript_9104:1718-2002(-)